MSAASCLITSDPHFEPPPGTAPFFLPDSATPNLGEVQQIFLNEPVEKIFSARIQSEDAESPVASSLYLDFGTRAEGQMYPDEIRGADLAAGSWNDEEPRLVSITYTGQFPLTEGCHRFSLMVAHDFDAIGCPIEDGDYDVQTWFVHVCLADDKDCLPFNPATCPDIVRFCPPAGGSQ